MMYLFHSGWKLFLTTTIYDMNLSAQTKCCSCCIHCHVTTTNDSNLLASDDRCIIFIIKCFHQITSGQILICREYTVCILTRNTHKSRKTCSGTNKYRIKALVIQKLINRCCLTNNNVCLDLYAQSLYILYLSRYDTILWQTELRDSVGKNTTGLVECLKNRYIISKLCQITGTGQTCRAGTDHSNLLALLLCSRLRLDTLLSCSISHITLQLTDGNGISLDTTNTLGLTLALLWTYPATDSRKCGIFADHLICTGYIVLSHFLNESRNINIYRASLNTTWILTLQTACCLCHCLFFIISQTNLIEVCGTYLWILLSDRNSLHNIYFHIYPHFCMRFS